MENQANTTAANQVANTAKKARRASTKKAKAPKAVEQTAVPATEAAPEATPTAPQQKLIVAKRIANGRWYVYFKGVPPEDNVGCGCKTAKSAIRYMLMIKRKFSAKIDEAIYSMLNAEAQAEAL